MASRDLGGTFCGHHSGTLGRVPVPRASCEDANWPTFAGQPSRMAFNPATRATDSRCDIPESRICTRRSIASMLAVRRQTTVSTAGKSRYAWRAKAPNFR